ncbi:winged helix-turn-helix transcriptional regulator [Lysobacter sp. H21R4]|nr:winged helix-turn-helix transcriptional regulator [Lysobacter sp. H21R4]
MRAARMPEATESMAAIDPEAMRSHAGDAVRLLKALGNENRLMLLCMLVAGEQSVSELNNQLDLSQSALSQHLALLRADGLVHTRRDAQTIYYSLSDGPARQIINTLHGIFCAVDAAPNGESR